MTCEKVFGLKHPYLEGSCLFKNFLDKEETSVQNLQSTLSQNNSYRCKLPQNQKLG